MDAVPGAAAALEWLRSRGVRLEAVTTRPVRGRVVTERLLGRLFQPGTFADMHFVSPGEKGVVCAQIGALALVDDQLPNAVDVAAHGVYALLFDFGGGYAWSHTGMPL